LKRYETGQLRNIGLIGHGGCGKTTLTEAMVYTGGATTRMGRVEEGNTLSDHDPEEVKRQVSVNTSVVPCEWRDTKINIVDTPGYADFVGEAVSALRAADCALTVVCAVSGVEVGTESTFKLAERRNLPQMAVVNKMDRENADFHKVLDRMREIFGNRINAIQLPIGSQASFSGVVDLIELKAYKFDGKSVKETAVPDDMMGAVEEHRSRLIEAAAEYDDEVLMKYLEGEELTVEEIRAGVKDGVLNRRIVPVLCSAASTGVGISTLMDFIAAYCPSPDKVVEARGVKPGTDQEVTHPVSADAPFSAQVFKTMADPYVGKLSMFKVFSGKLKSDSTVHNVSKRVDERVGQVFLTFGKEQISVSEVVAGDIAAVAKLGATVTGDTLGDRANPILFPSIDFPKPKLTLAAYPLSKGDEDKIASGLSRLAEEDPTVSVDRNSETRELLISGMGELHVEIVKARLKKKFGADIELRVPKVPYRETVRAKSQAEGKHKKQTGGRGQYGHVILEMEPLADKEFEFVDKIFGGAVPKNYIPAVEKGALETLAEGPYAGFPMVNVRITLLDGSYHAVDSSEMAFKIATSLAIKKALDTAKPVLLEPVMYVEVRVPEAYMGDIMGDMNKRRGRILGMEPDGDYQVVKAMAPLAEMYRYAIDLRSMTQGRGDFTMEFRDYEEVPAQIAEKVIEEAKKQRES
jgi:elongation factor G